jgi:hypothetical protein
VDLETDEGLCQAIKRQKIELEGAQKKTIRIAAKLGEYLQRLFEMRDVSWQIYLSDRFPNYCLSWANFHRGVYRLVHQYPRFADLCIYITALYNNVPAIENYLMRNPEEAEFWGSILASEESDSGVGSGPIGSIDSEENASEEYEDSGEWTSRKRRRIIEHL